MAVKIPLVLGNPGLIEQLQSGDTIAGQDSSIFNQTANSTFANPGTPVYSITADSVEAADANSSLPTAQVVALLVTGGSSGNPVPCQASGLLALTTGEWDAVTGGSGGLTQQAEYFLSTTAGQLTTSPTSTPGEYVVPVGIALSPTKLLIRIGRPILN